MKKIFLSVFGFLFICLVGVYVFLFTSFGNSYVSSIIESSANEKGIVKFKLEKFILTFNSINLIATIDTNSKVTLLGNYNIFSRWVNINYLIDIKDLSKLEKFTTQKLIGSLALMGSIKGNEKEALVVGKSNIFDSVTSFDIKLKEYQPQSIDIKIQNAKIEQLLSMINQPTFANGITDIMIKINDTNIKTLNGKIDLDISSVTLNNKTINKNFDLNLTKVVNINGKINSELKPNQVISKVNINSNLAKIFLKKSILNLKNKSIDSDYLITISSLLDLSDFIDTSSKEGFEISGRVKGDEKLLDILGKSNIFQSETAYDINLKNKKPNKINLNIKDAKLNEVLAFSNQPIFATGLLDINAKIKDANIGTLDGSVTTNLKKVKLNNTIINKNFNLKLKKSISLTLKSNSLLKGEGVISSLDLKSSLLNLKSKSVTINLKNSTIKSDFNLEIANLNNMTDLIGFPLNGSFNVSGDLNGNEKELKLVGRSDIFESISTFDVLLKEFKPSFVKANIKSAKIQKILYTINQPKLASGLININADIKNANLEKLSGKIDTKILHGILNNKNVNKLYDLKLKKQVDFKGDINTNLEPNTLISTSKLITSLADINVPKTIINLKDNSIKSDYEVFVSDLNNLYDLTNTKLRGKLKVNGKINKTKNLNITGQSSFLSGNFDFLLTNDDLEATTKNIETKEVLKMLYYPIVFDSKFNSDLKYNLKTQQGLLDANLLNGKILPNQYTNTIKQLINFDMTQEIYTNALLKSKINKKIISSSLDMNSKNTEIDVTKSIIDLNKRKINALVQTRIKKIEFETKISGSLDKPKVKIQTNKLIKSTIKTKVYEEVEKKIFKKFGNDAVKDLLKGLFK